MKIVGSVCATAIVLGVIGYYAINLSPVVGDYLFEMKGEDHAHRLLDNCRGDSPARKSADCARAALLLSNNSCASAGSKLGLFSQSFAGNNHIDALNIFKASPDCNVSFKRAWKIKKVSGSDDCTRDAGYTNIRPGVFVPYETNGAILSLNKRQNCNIQTEKAWFVIKLENKG